MKMPYEDEWNHGIILIFPVRDIMYIQGYYGMDIINTLINIFGILSGHCGKFLILLYRISIRLLFNLLRDNYTLFSV